MTKTIERPKEFQLVTGKLVNTLVKEKRSRLLKDLKTVAGCIDQMDISFEDKKSLFILFIWHINPELPLSSGLNKYETKRHLDHAFFRKLDVVEYPDLEEMLKSARLSKKFRSSLSDS